MDGAVIIIFNGLALGLASTLHCAGMCGASACGLMFSQLVTLYLTPVFYTYMAALQTKLGKGKKPRTIAREPEPVATGD